VLTADVTRRVRRELASVARAWRLVPDLAQGLPEPSESLYEKRRAPEIRWRRQVNHVVSNADNGVVEDLD
jgi:hypothetical protein